MASMTDPMDGLVSFQKAFRRGEIELQKAELYPDVFVHLDQPTMGVSRYTYVTLKGKTVTSLAMIVMADRIEGLPCFQLGVAVPVAHRRNGYAKAIVAAAIAELKNGLARNNIPTFYVEAVVSVNNHASKRVAETTISPSSTPITDSVSGLPALHYLSKI